ncbi:sugar phosphate nucleotidyltransferase [Ligilactobacillus sp.]|uniref:sugar phosphate nucleotidyltransferase n=1 Tax=Ligilactobacillus sp. TaxID=2767921 RepID=UPI002FDF8DE6
MHQIKRAVIMASGFGSRMRPLTLKIPKPLVRVNGVAMIETVIGGLIENGITEIHIVTGYMAEKFGYLKERFPEAEIDLIYNPYYETFNNISSLYVAREFLDSVIIIDGDQVISDVSILSPWFERSGYNSVHVSDGTDEWLQQVDDEGTVVSCSRTGGRSGWQLYGISRWTKEDAGQLKCDLEFEFEVRRNFQAYWDDVAMFCHPNHYRLKVFPMKKDAVTEIDTMKELAEIDSSYRGEDDEGKD